MISNRRIIALFAISPFFTAAVVTMLFYFFFVITKGSELGFVKILSEIIYMPLAMIVVGIFGEILFFIPAIVVAMVYIKLRNKFIPCLLSGLCIFLEIYVPLKMQNNLDLLNNYIPLCLSIFAIITSWVVIKMIERNTTSRS
ncbi:MAG: hypothetical protein IJV56_10225 [Neisseriaceae bacterium]|nr:hypothetical protein [Neisseriaceae bacterium]